MGKNTAIVLAAGQGKRMNSKIQKQFLEIQGRPLLYYSLCCFQESPLVDEIILVTGKQSIDYCQKEIVKKYDFTKVKKIIEGGRERYDSVYAGLLACEDTEYVMIHDGARPFITQDMIERGMVCVKKTGACSAGMPSKDTVKIVDSDGFVRETPERNRVWIIQTPQIFSYSLIRKAHESIHKENMANITDDAMIVESQTSVQVALFEGSYRNIKITTSEDLYVAEAFLKK